MPPHSFSSSSDEEAEGGGDDGEGPGANASALERALAGLQGGGFSRTLSTLSAK